MLNVVPEVPRELAKVTIPDYIIEPPDVLAVDAINLLPKAPYKLRPLDVVTIASTGLPEEIQLAGEFMVQPDGMVQLGFEFGSVRAAGRTLEELQASIMELLKDFQNPDVLVTLRQLAGQQEITGEHLVGPDGKVNLGSYGRVRVVGLTIEEASEAIESHLEEFLEEPRISVDVLGYNSKVIYVITQGAGLGDTVILLPAKGNETVLDAIGQIQGLQSNSSTKMWIARPGSNQCGGDQILPVDWLAVTQRGDITTNYQLLPGDRLFVAEDKLVALDTALAKLISPAERLFGFTILGTDMVSRLRFFHLGGFQNFGGGF